MNSYKTSELGKTFTIWIIYDKDPNFKQYL